MAQAPESAAGAIALDLGQGRTARVRLETCRAAAQKILVMKFTLLKPIRSPIRK
jgi:hypothetical protein